jgi:CBS domain-containing protein
MLYLYERRNSVKISFRTLHAPKRTAADVMTAPVVTVDEDADIREIARLLDTHRIKRVPVLRGGSVVGVVSRADLVRAVAA